MTLLTRRNFVKTVAGGLTLPALEDADMLVMDWYVKGVQS
jgi:hypothetical protein